MFNSERQREQTVVITRTSRVGCSYLQNASLLTQPGLRDGHRSGFLNNKTMQLTKMLTFTKFYTSFQTHCVPVMPSFTTPLSDNPAHRFSGKYKVVHRVKYKFLASYQQSVNFESLKYVEIVEICSFFCFVLGCHYLVYKAL